MLSRFLKRLRSSGYSGDELPDEVLENIQKTLAVMDQMVFDALNRK